MMMLSLVTFFILSASADMCNLLLQPPFVEWSNDKLISQSHDNLKYIQKLPYKYPDSVTHVDGRIAMSGMPGIENNLYIKTLTPDQIQGKVFRFFTDKQGLEQASESGRLMAQSNAYAESQFYYQDLTGVLLSPPASQLDDIHYWKTNQREWIDVTLDPQTAILQLDKNSYLIPGSGATPSWLVDAVKKAATSSSALYQVQRERMNNMGWTPMQIPVSSIVNSSKLDAALKSKQNTLPRSEAFANEPLLSMFYGYEGETLRVGDKRVHYLSAEERKEYRARCDDQGRLLNHQGELVSTHGQEHAIGVLTMMGELMISDHSETAQGLIQHSSFTGGQPVISAFTLKVTDGKPEIITNQSGHYLSSERAVAELAVDALKKVGCQTSSLRFVPFSE